MTMLRNVELTETLHAIMSRNTEYYQTDYAEDMQELLHGRQRHYLFMSYRMGTLLVPEESVYTRESSCRKGWLECGEERPDLVRAFAARVDRRMPPRARARGCGPAGLCQSCDRCGDEHGVGDGHGAGRGRASAQPA